jgi:hypothetical protein
MKIAGAVFHESKYRALGPCGESLVLEIECSYSRRTDLGWVKLEN